MFHSFLMNAPLRSFRRSESLGRDDASWIMPSYYIHKSERSGQQRKRAMRAEGASSETTDNVLAVVDDTTICKSGSKVARELDIQGEAVALARQVRYRLAYQTAQLRSQVGAIGGHGCSLVTA